MKRDCGSTREAGKQTRRRRRRRERRITLSSGTEDRKGGEGDDRNWKKWVERCRKWNRIEEIKLDGRREGSRAGDIGWRDENTEEGRRRWRRR